MSLQDRTASQTLIDALEAFGDSEGRTVVIVFTDANADITVARHMILTKERAS